MPETRWIGVDWGSTRLRAWRFGAGAAPMGAVRRDLGADRLAPRDYTPALLAAVADWLPPGAACPVVVCGAAGAREGWAPAPYRAVPATPAGPDRAVRAVSDPRLDVAILPGLSQAGPPDTMRGEETQIAGYLAGDPEFDGVLCLPGTQTKWAHISAGEVVSFRTFLTGTLFAHLAEASVLRHGIDPQGWDEAAFADAVGDAMARPQGVAAALYGVRAAWLLDGLSPASAHARLSGLLIGMELAGARPYWLGQGVVVLGTGRMADGYAAALAAQGAPVRQSDAEDAVIAGLSAAARALGFAGA